MQWRWDMSTGKVSDNRADSPEGKSMGASFPPDDVLGVDKPRDKSAPRSHCSAARARDHQELIDDPVKAATELAYALRELHDFAEVDRHHRYEERSKAAFRDAAALLCRLGF